MSNNVGDLIDTDYTKKGCYHCGETKTHINKDGRFTYVCGYSAGWESKVNKLRVETVCERYKSTEKSCRPMNNLYVKTNCSATNRLLAELGKGKGYYPNSENRELDEAYGLRFGLYSNTRGGAEHEGKLWPGHIELLGERVWNSCTKEINGTLKTVEEMIQFLKPKVYDGTEFRVILNCEELVKMFKSFLFARGFKDYGEMRKPHYVHIWTNTVNAPSYEIPDKCAAKSIYEKPNWVSIEEAFSRLGL